MLSRVPTEPFPRLLLPLKSSIITGTILDAMMRLRIETLLLAALAALVAASGLMQASSSRGSESGIKSRQFRIPKATSVRLQAFKADPPEVALGERLFLETRFAQFFFAHSHGNANATLAKGDPILATSQTASGSSLPGPFAGLSMNCRACHLVAEQAPLRRGNRSYADYARRSPIPARDDGKEFTVRNSQPIVNALVAREGDLFLHNDGEFGSAAELVKATVTGRNFGWLPAERNQAVQHAAHTIRHDDGKGQLAREFGGYSYAKVFAGSTSEIEEDYLLPEEFRLNVANASDDEILDAIGRAVEAYMRSLRYSRDSQLEYDSSPYDVFLEKNKLPRKRSPGQSASYYIRNLISLLDDLKEPRYVTPADKCFKTLKQDFRFGPQELAGMRTFFARPASGAAGGSQRRSVGNCVACHTPPHFTDFAFHSTGASQLEYDSIHGQGTFASLIVPGLPERETNYDAWLPATANHPKARGTLCEIPTRDFPERADLGLWNVFANPDQPAVQPALLQMLIGERRPQPADVLLPRTIALFKTPTLRGLGHSHPYLHNGSRESLEEVVQFYIKTSALARSGQIRNAASELSEIRLNDDDIAPVAAFLRALNEDYE